MTDTERQELRDWSAEVMGWELYYHNTSMGCTEPIVAWYWRDKTTKGIIMRKGQWNPLTDLNQAFVVVERMRELGWVVFKIAYSHELTAYDPPVPAYYHAVFWNYEQPAGHGYEPNPATAILKAAKATEAKP